MLKPICRISITLCCVMIFGGMVIAQKSRSSVPAAEVNGTFRMNFTGKYKGSFDEVKILALGGGRLRVAMDLVYPYTVKGDLLANIGELDGHAVIKGDVAIYASPGTGKCTITIKFVRPGTIKVSQEGSDADCGFGHNVMSDGIYRKVSGAKPKFEDGL